MCLRLSPRAAGMLRLLVCAALAMTAAAEDLVVTTFAGPGMTPTSGDGAGTAARFYRPEGVAADSNGSVFVADRLNHTIRKIAAAGEVSTVAGLAGSAGSADGAGAAARFNQPTGIAVDADGNLYVADCGNHTVRKITPAGAVTTLAGAAGLPGAADGTGSAARFSNPRGVALDASRNLYVADASNHTLRKVTPAGAVTTLAGSAGNAGSTDAAGAAARFNTPAGVAVDDGGNLYVADSGNHTLRQVTPGGVVTTFAGEAGNAGSADGTGSVARFNCPCAVAVDGGRNLYVTDQLNHTLRKVTPLADVTTLAGLGASPGSADGNGAAARFNEPAGVAVGASGNVWVGDAGNHTLRLVTLAGDVSTFAGSAPGFGSADGAAETARFYYPGDVAADGAGNIYVADQQNQTIRKITPAGNVTTLAGQAGTPGSADGVGNLALFNTPTGVAVDAAGNVYVADYRNETIRQIAPDGTVTTLAGLTGNAGSADGIADAARFSSPQGVAVDGSGNLYVADRFNYAIRKIAPGAVVSTLAGLAGNPGSADGNGSAARFNHPVAVDVDGAGNVYVADSANHTLRKITPAGDVTTLAGLAGVSGSTDGAGGAARFSSPVGVAVDAAGNVFVSDLGNHTLRKVTPAGVVITLAGSAGNPGYVDATGSAARFSLPFGLALAGGGALYVADEGNHAIRLATLTLSDAATVDQASGPVNVVRQLDTDPRTAVTWQWSIIRRPAASTAGFSSVAARNPTFTPDVPDLFRFQLAAADGAGRRSLTTVDLGAFIPPPPPVITSATAATGAVGAAFSYTIMATNSPTSFSAADLPAGLSVNTSTGAITGTPTAAGATDATISATNLGGTGSATLRITILPPPPVITSALTASGSLGNAFSYAITATNGPTSFSAASLPAGLSVDTNTGAIAGTPTAIGATDATISATNAGGTGAATLRITIAPSGPPAVTATASQNPVRTGRAVTFTATASHPDNLPLTFDWNFGDGSPAGSGTSLAHSFAGGGVFTVTVHVGDGCNTVQARLTMTVFAPASGGSEVASPNTGATVSNPLAGITVHVVSAEGGVVELEVAAAGAAPASCTVRTDFSGPSGQVVTVYGPQPVQQFTEPGIYVAVVTITDNVTGLVLGTARIMLPVGVAETGGAIETTAPLSLALTGALKGKFYFDSQKPDTISFKGSFELPGGLKLAEERTCWVGVGNVTDAVSLDAKGKAKSAGALGRVSKLAVKYPRLKKPATTTSARQKALLRFSLKVPDLDALGFDTEGITASLLPDEAGLKSVQRAVQVALVLAGAAYRGEVPVALKLSKRRDSGTITTCPAR